jgi:hypothetical protein
MKGLLPAALLVATVSVSAPAFAQQASSKFSATTSNRVLISPTSSAEWQTVMSTALKLPSQKDLFAQMAMECGLFTRTSVGDQATDLMEDDTADRSSAEAVVRARVIVVNSAGVETPAHPGEITLCARSQRLTALFNGICYDQDGDGVVQYSECDNNEELDLAVKTLNASAFNFVLQDLKSDTYTVKVQAMIESRTNTCDTSTLLGGCIDGSTGDGSAEAMGMVGNGSLAIEEVRMVKGADPVDETTGEEEGDFFDYFMNFGL